MKKNLITMAVLIGMVGCAMVFSSFSASKTVVEKEWMKNEAVPTYWEGSARSGRNSWDYLYIKVYQTEGQCNSFYAIITRSYSGPVNDKEVWVKPNPDFKSTSSQNTVEKNRYYVTFRQDNYYFNM